MPRPRILVVDDHQPALAFMSGALRAAGYEVDAVTDGVAAAVRVHTSQYDLVISDIMMPELRGTALLKLVKAESPRTPVILVTGYLQKVRAGELLAQGAVALLEKPFTVGDLLARVRGALSRGAPAPPRPGREDASLRDEVRRILDEG